MRNRGAEKGRMRTQVVCNYFTNVISQEIFPENGKCNIISINLFLSKTI